MATALGIDDVYRDNKVKGDIHSGEHFPDKAEIRAGLKAWLGGASNPSIVKQTKAALDAVTPASENYGGLVLKDPDPQKNGYYYRSAGAWVKGRGFQDTMATVALSGTSAAQTGLVEPGVNPADVAVFFAVVATPNGASGLTLRLSSDPTPRTVVNAAGNSLATGEWTGAVLFFLNDDGQYQLLLDAGAVASSAQNASDAQAARNEAVAATVFNPVIMRFISSGAGPYDMEVPIGSANLLDVKLGGVWQDHDKYTIDGTTFTFTFDPGASLEMEAVLRADVRRADAPSDGSVVPESLALSTISYFDGLYVRENVGNQMPTICLTFDEYPEGSTTAYTIMQTYGLVGTYFVTPSTIGTTGTTGPTAAALSSMKGYGYEIGAYGGTNFVTLWNGGAGRDAVIAKFKQLKDDMYDAGFPVTTIAPGQRAWNQSVRNLCEDFFTHARVVDNFRETDGYWQQLPVPDRLWVKRGGSPSLKVGDTGASLSAQVDDLIALGGLWTVVIHRVAESGDVNYRIPAAEFSAFCQKIAAERNAGRLRVVRFRDL